ncbi:MAG TPA: heme biosynthesis HemY N-terminal domain-containing protein [Stellaceae bacterium]|nr:heme biosynthesis HemY N-terminal domain-containing protein [Stellaceae bacterium]
MIRLIRLLLALALIAAAVAAGAFFAGNPGQVDIVWQGWRIDTSVGVLLGAAALIGVAVALLALFVAALRRTPRNVRRRRAARRRHAGEAALTRGLVALAAGDAGEARRHGRRASAFLADSPTALLLAAEAAHREGDAAAARQAYTLLLQRPDSEFLGLRGLIGQALREGDDAAARPLAERARLLRPGARWLADSLVLLQARAGDWAAVHETLAAAARRGALPAEAAHHHRGVALHELSSAAERDGDLRKAVGLAAKAQALAPDLAEPALHHARLLCRLGRRRAAAKAVERAWRAAPHRELARCYAEIDADAAPLARAAAVQKLAAHNPRSVESRLAAAEAALDARLWGEARRHLDPDVATAAASGADREQPSRRLCLAMARLEEGASGDLAAARRWLDRALGAPPEPSYICRRCGAAAAQWQALCQACGAYDTLAWQTPEAAARARRGALLAGPPEPILPATDVSTRPGGTLPDLAPSVQSDN